MLLIILMFSPIIVALVTIGMLVVLRRRAPILEGLGLLSMMTLVFGIAAAAISLAGTLVWVEWYENTKGYSAGNAIVGWMFFLGPVSFAIGQVAALILWLYRRGLIHR